MANKLIKVNTQIQGPVYFGAESAGQIGGFNSYVNISYENNESISLTFHSSQKGQLTSDSLVSGTTHTLVDTNATFVTDGVEVGDQVQILRFPNGNYQTRGAITAVVSETELTVDTTEFGTQPGLGPIDQHYMIRSNANEPFTDAADKVIEAIAKAVTSDDKDMIIELPECYDKFGPITFTTAIAN